jgi:hypothetical protein
MVKAWSEAPYQDLTKALASHVYVDPSPANYEGYLLNLNLPVPSVKPANEYEFIQTLKNALRRDREEAHEGFDTRQPQQTVEMVQKPLPVIDIARFKPAEIQQQLKASYFAGAPTQQAAEAEVAEVGYHPSNQTYLQRAIVAKLEVQQYRSEM